LGGEGEGEEGEGDDDEGEGEGAGGEVRLGGLTEDEEMAIALAESLIDAGH